MVASQLINHIIQLLATHYGNEILRNPLLKLKPFTCIGGESQQYFQEPCTSSNLSGYEFVSRKLNTNNFVSYRN